MGAGYAAACHGVLRMPLGDDATGKIVLREVLAQHIRAVPLLMDDCPSDSSLVILSSAGDKLAVGVRTAMVRWRPTADDWTLVEHASALVCCGAPNAFTRTLLSRRPAVPVMCAPAMRNVCDRSAPLAELAPGIHYLALNALEWAALEGQSQCREHIPVITVTDGPRGSRILLRGGPEFTLPALPALPAGPVVNTNRAGETYGATFFKALQRYAPDFFRTGKVNPAAALRAGELATAQATRQLAIAGFGFPPEESME